MMNNPLLTGEPGPEIVNEEELSQEQVGAMTQDERFAKLIAYRKMVADGKQLAITTHGNALRILRAVRHKSIADNPRAKAGAKKKAESATAMDLSSFLPPAK